MKNGEWKMNENPYASPVYIEDEELPPGIDTWNYYRQMEWFARGLGMLAWGTVLLIFGGLGLLVLAGAVNHAVCILPGFVIVVVYLVAAYVCSQCPKEVVKRVDWYLMAIPAAWTYGGVLIVSGVMTRWGSHDTLLLGHGIVWAGSLVWAVFLGKASRSLECEACRKLAGRMWWLCVAACVVVSVPAGMAVWTCPPEESVLHSPWFALAAVLEIGALTVYVITCFRAMYALRRWIRTEILPEEELIVGNAE